MRQLTIEQLNKVFNSRRNRLTHAFEYEELIGSRIYIYLEGNYVPVVASIMKHYDENMYLYVPTTPSPETLKILDPADYSKNLYIA